MPEGLSITIDSVEVLVEKCNNLFRELEEYKALYNEAASLLNSANNKLSQIMDIVDVKTGLTDE